MNEQDALKPITDDLSEAFKTMDALAFKDLIKTKADEPVLAIRYRLTGNFGDDCTALGRLQAFLDQSPQGQKRFVTVLASDLDFQKHIEDFESGIKREKI